MKIHFFPFVLSIFFLAVVSCPALAEKTPSSRTSETILGHLYVGSISIARESINEFDGATLQSVNNGITIAEMREVTVSGASLAACQKALLEVLSKTKNVVSRVDCKAKDRDISMIMPNR